MSLELVVTKNGGIKCSMSPSITTKIPASTEDIPYPDRWEETQIDLSVPEVELLATPISNLMNFTFEFGTVNNVTCTYIESSYVKAGNDSLSPVLLDSIKLSGGTVTLTTTPAAAGTFSSVDINNKKTAKTLHKNIEAEVTVTKSILLKGASNSVNLTLELVPPPGTVDITLTFTISDAGQTKVTAD